jgi:hypothetical protein
MKDLRVYGLLIAITIILVIVGIDSTTCYIRHSETNLIKRSGMNGYWLTEVDLYECPKCGQSFIKIIALGPASGNTYRATIMVPTKMQSKFMNLFVDENFNDLLVDINVLLEEK